MKKLITLLLVLTGMVGTVSAEPITIYVANDAAWTNVYLHEWGGITGTSWPGNIQPLCKIINGKWYFKVTISGTDFILNGGNDSNKTGNQTTSDYTDGNYYSNSGNVLTQISAPTEATYTYNFSVTSSENIYNLYLYKGEAKYAGNWPGAYITAENGVYNFTYGTSENLGELKVIIKGTDSKQTGDLWANPGDNKYNIASLASSKNNNSWGEGVEIKGSGYATYVCYNKLSIPSGIAYYATDNGTGSATAHELTNPDASTPMLVKGTANTIYHFATASSSTDDASSNAFKAGGNANLASTTIVGENTYYNYILNSGDFYAAGGQYVANNKAYLQLSKQAGTGANARVLIFPGDDETQGINAIPTAKANDGAYYNLSGQRVNAPTKGLYIQNGKKMIVK